MLPPGSLVAMTPAHARDEHAPRLRLRRPAGLTVMLLLALTCGPAQAQRVALSLHAGTGSGTATVSATAAVTGLRAHGNDVDVWARLAAGTLVGEHGAAPDGTVAAFGVGAAWRRATTFGPLGNVLVEGGGSLGWIGTGSDGLRLRSWLGARGTLANVALTLAAEAGNAAPGQLDPGRPPPADAAGQTALRDLDVLRARFDAPAGSWDAGVRLALAYRLDRDVTLDADAAARRLADASWLRGQVALRRARLDGDVDGWLALQGESYAGDASLAVGVGVFHAPRRGPTSWLRVWFGAGADGVRPGVEGRWSGRFAIGDVRLQASWRPWLGSTAWYAEAGLDQVLPAGDVRWSLDAAGAAGGGSTWRVGVRLLRPSARP